MTLPASESRAEPADPVQLVNDAAQRLEREVRSRQEAIKGLRGLTRSGTIGDLEKFRKALPKVLGPLRAPGLGLEGLADELEALPERLAAEGRRRFGRELREACEAAGVALRVVRSEEPLELRLAPLSVEVDHRRGRARLAFARNVLAECAADAREVLAAHRKLVASLEGPFDPTAYFEACWRAYRSALAVEGKRMQDRVELLDFLPRLALELQGKKFRVDPTAEHFEGYPRARFAYDVLRLRRAGALEQQGRRIQFGVATGTSATQKDRVVYLEDEEGRGEYKLTVFFRVEEPA